MSAAFPATPLPERGAARESGGGKSRSPFRLARYRTTTPHGSLPTGMSRSLVRLAVSMTLTLLERPFATYSFLPSGVIAMFQGRWPTGTVATIWLLAVSTTDTLASPPFDTYTYLPLG